jgi:hypothetical protein
MNSETKMPEDELKMPLKDARRIVETYEKDFNEGIIAYPEVKKDLDLARKVLHNYWIRVFRRMD